MYWHVHIMLLSSRGDHRIIDPPILTAALPVCSVQHNAAWSDDITRPKFSMMHSSLKMIKHNSFGCEGETLQHTYNTQTSSSS